MYRKPSPGSQNNRRLFGNVEHQLDVRACSRSGTGRLHMDELVLVPPGPGVRSYRGWNLARHVPTLDVNQLLDTTMKTLPEQLRYSTGHCQFGGLLLAVGEDGVAAILLGDDDDSMAADLQQRFTGARLERDDSALAADMQALLSYVDHPLGQLDLARPLAARGSAFQKKVWAELARVPAGQTITYTELARRVGNPAAVRAVAGACAANPLAMVVPCHRVLRSDGGISGYRWGVERKRKLIELERELAGADQAN